MSFPEIDLITRLREEHHFIDRAMGSLYHWGLKGQQSEPGARDSWVRFLEVFVHAFHHQREEDLLFEVLVSRLELSPDNGPIRILREEHHEETALARALAEALPGPATQKVATEIAGHVWEHLDKENSVVFAEGNERLVRSGIRRLEDRAMREEEAQARRTIEKLIEKWPPLDDPDHIRGDGCMPCSAYGVSCGGVEKEWWNQWDWERMDTFQG